MSYDVVMPSLTQRRVEWMDQLRGLAILLVIIVHAEAVVRPWVTMPAPVIVILEALAPFRIPTLVFLSGMLLERSLAKPTGVYFAGKLRAIAWPYVLWSVAFLAISGALSVGTLIRVGIVPPTYLWYLYFLLVYYALAWIMRKARIPFWVAMIVGFALSFSDDPYRGGRLGFLMVFFFAGWYMTRYWAPWVLRHRSWLTAPGALAMIAGGWISAAGVPVRYEPLPILLTAGGVLFGVCAMSFLEGAGWLRPVASVGRASIVFYVTHYPVIYLLGLALDWAGVGEPLVYLVVGIVAALAVGAVFVALRKRSRIVAALFDFPRRVYA